MSKTMLSCLGIKGLGTETMLGKVCCLFRRKKKKGHKPLGFVICTSFSVHLLPHQLHLRIVYAEYTNVKKEQVRKCIKCCRLLEGDNQLTDLQRQVDFLRRINEFKRSWDDTWLLLGSAGVTAEREEGWLCAQQVELGATCPLLFYARC